MQGGRKINTSSFSFFSSSTAATHTIYSKYSTQMGFRKTELRPKLNTERELAQGRPNFPVSKIRRNII